MSARRTRAAAGGVVLLTLTAGFFLGLLWSRMSSAQAEPVAPAAAQAAEEEDAGRGRRRGLIVERVGLSAEQKVRVDSVVSHARGAMRQLRADYRAGYGELVESARSSIKAVLTPEQVEEYDALLTDFDRRRSEEAERAPPAARERDRGRDGRERSRRERRDEDEGDGRKWSYEF